MIELDEIIKNIIDEDKIGFDISFEYAKNCSMLLRKQETKSLGRKLIINIIDNWKKIDESTHDIWIDLIESEGFYPYLEKEKLNLTSTASALRKEMSKSKNLDFYLHEEQMRVKNLLDSDKNVIVSAPTSFGKSLLIEELVAERKYNNIVIIQPTLALLDETRKKLKKYDEHYHIIVRTSQEPSSQKGNLFLLTAERVMEYYDIPFIDLLIIDEFYKLSANRDDERSDVLNNAFHMLLKRDNVKFYLLGPNIDEISDGFIEKYNAVFYKTDYTLVEQLVYEKYSEEFGDRGVAKENKESALFIELLKLKDEQTMIYCSSPRSARSLAKKFLSFLQEYTIKNDYDISLIEWIEQYVHKNWMLIECLNYGIAFHDGALQKHISSSIIKYFNEKKLHFLFCTSTIIEGVNTSANNIIIFDKYKGQRKPENIIDYFDYSNIKGRAGRMMIHYIGKVYNFNEPFIESKNLKVDIPFFEQNPIKNEVLIHLDEEDIIDKTSTQYKEISALSNDEKNLFKKNGVSVKGQQNILKIIRKNISSKKELILWNRKPNYEQLKYILTLAWNNLIKEGETTSPMNLGNLVRVTYWYETNASIGWLVKDIYSNDKKNIEWVSENQNRITEKVKNLSKDDRKEYKTGKEWKKFEANKSLMKLDDLELIDKAIREAFNILKHWFQYKVPKWLRTINTIQEFVCLEKNIKSGNYLYYANRIESDFIRDNLSILREYGIPKSAINKIEKYITSDMDENEVVKLVKSKKFIEQINFIAYEKEKIEDSL